MKKILLALFLVGCSSQAPVAEPIAVPPEVKIAKNICRLQEPEYVSPPKEVKGGNENTICFDRSDYILFALSSIQYIMYVGDIKLECIGVNHGR